MLALLAEIRDQDLAHNPLYSRELAQREALEYHTLHRRAGFEQRITALFRLAQMQLIVGESHAAAKHLDELWALCQSAGDDLSREEKVSVLLSLAIAHLRCGELENCIKSCTCESCILPIRGAGVHSWRQGSENAVEACKQLLELDPDHLTGRWLLNIAAMTLGDYPANIPERFLLPPDALKSATTFPQFRNDAAIVGLDMVGLSGGVVADDFDNDGWLDLLISDWGPEGQIRFYRNDGSGKFDDRTEEAGLIGLLGGFNLIQADYDNDGDLDVYVLRGAWRGENGRHPDSLLQNDGQARFLDVTFHAGLGEIHYPSGTAAWSDYDLDGDLDLFVGNEDHPCQLFENNGRGKFQDVAQRAGVTNDRFTKGVSWGDYNDDGYPDIYVSNYGTPAFLSGESQNADDLFNAVEGKPNRLYRNNGDGTFTDVAEELAVTRPLLGFPAWFWDVNNDGVLDIFAASYAGTTGDVCAEYLGLSQAAEPDCLYLGDGQGGFQEVGQQFGLHRVTLAMGSNFGDLDNDGFDDFYLGTGGPAYDSLVPNIMYRNVAGREFADITGSGFGHLQKGHGVAFADLNNDGDQDVVSVMGGAFGGDVFSRVLFENPGFNQHWLRLKLIGRRSNRSAIGAKVCVEIEEDGTTRAIYKWVNSGGSFGANPLRREIGLGRAAKIKRLTIDWPAKNSTTVLHDVPLNQALEITEGESSFRVVPN